MSKRILKEGFVKVLIGEKNLFTVGNIKLGKKTKWNKQYLNLSQDEKDKKLQIWIFDSQNEAYKGIPKSIFTLDSNTEATQMAATHNEQFCCIISSSKETLTISCEHYGELLNWISNVNRYVNGFSRLPSKQGRLPQIPKEEDIKKDLTRGVSDPGMKRGTMNEIDNETGLREHNYECPARVVSTFDIENNEIYGERNIFSVEIEQNETSERLNLAGGYNLLLQNDGIQLMAQDSYKVIYFWPVKVLRRFGSSNSRFSFESGRSSQSGVGNFVFFTPSCKLINEEVTNLTERIRLTKSSSDVVRIDSKSNLIRDISPLTTVHNATNVQTSFVSEKFAEKLQESHGEKTRANPIASVDSINDNAFYARRVDNEREINPRSTKKSLPLETGNIGDYSLNEMQKSSLKKIRSSQTSDQDSNTIEFNTNPHTTHLDRSDYVNLESYIKATVETQDPSISDNKTPLNAEDYRKMLPIAYERMRSESEPTPPKICLPNDANNSIYVNLQNIPSIIPDEKIPMASRECHSTSVENLSMSPEKHSRMQKSVHSLSTQNLTVLHGNQEFELQSDPNFQQTSLPKSLSLIQIAHPQEQQKLQYYPPQQQQFYIQHPCPPTSFLPQQFYTEQNQQQYSRGVERFYQQQTETHRQVMYPPNTEISYLQPQRQQYNPSGYPPDSFQPQISTRQYPRSAPSSGMIDTVQRPAIREVYPGSAPNTGSHSMQRDAHIP